MAFGEKLSFDIANKQGSMVVFFVNDIERKRSDKILTKNGMK